ncbi:MAG: hypothetical protein MJK04_15695, partial [Psychrosphaera sp.]|nr:hypothetical protein [Psychrosphaera sp.]
MVRWRFQRKLAGITLWDDGVVATDSEDWDVRINQVADLYNPGKLTLVGVPAGHQNASSTCNKYDSGVICKVSKQQKTLIHKDKLQGSQGKNGHYSFVYKSAISEDYAAIDGAEINVPIDINVYGVTEKRSLKGKSEFTFRLPALDFEETQRREFTARDYSKNHSIDSFNCEINGKDVTCRWPKNLPAGRYLVVDSWSGREVVVFFQGKVNWYTTAWLWPFSQSEGEVGFLNYAFLDKVTPVVCLQNAEVKVNSWWFIPADNESYTINNGGCGQGNVLMDLHIDVSDGERFWHIFKIIVLILLPILCVIVAFGASFAR